jgi:hypothetical protein
MMICLPSLPFPIPYAVLGYHVHTRFGEKKSRPKSEKPRTRKSRKADREIENEKTTQRSVPGEQDQTSTQSVKRGREKWPGPLIRLCLKGTGVRDIV